MMAMPRTTALALVLLAVAICPNAAVALGRDDTMGDWLQASEADRSHLLDELLGGERPASRAKVAECMKSAAEIAGHCELRIGDVAEACSEPATPPDDI